MHVILVQTSMLVLVTGPVVGKASLLVQPHTVGDAIICALWD